MTQEQVVAQNVLLLAGYETTSTRNPECRINCARSCSIRGNDPTWDQLVSELPYLDAIAAHDDVVPLGTPVVTPSGETISTALWGQMQGLQAGAWFEEISVPARELQGHRHLLSFHDGPRTCLGKSFALAEFKFPDGPETKLETHTTIVPRPKVVGQNGAKVP
ncbi:hypothetical protein K438DRAFT_1850109 [Mycena galopus ATCC 62051]|nr:hypothetical protein K438DRAFT_1850109 [Mycena galopus ATCC 62051]